MVVEKVDFYGLSPETVEKYLPMKNCGKCGFRTCREMAQALSGGKAKIEDCPEIDLRMREGLAGPLGIKLEVHEADASMSTVTDKLIELNGPGADSPVLATGNCDVTIHVLKLIFERTPGVSAWILPTETKGFTVDHAAAMKLMTPITVMRALTMSGVQAKVNHRELTIPGLCAGIEKQVEQITRWHTTPGPTSGFELPAYILSKRE